MSNSQDAGNSAKLREAEAALNHLENVFSTKDGRVHFSDIVRVGEARALLAKVLAEPSRVYNEAKVREALSDACYAIFNFLKTQNGGYEEMANALDKAKAALAAPPRNCDDVVTWLDLYSHFHPPKGMREMPPEWVDAITAFCQWLVAPAKERKGDAE